MEPRSHRDSHGSLSEVRGQFKRWRRSRRRGTRIPGALWQAAVAAAREHGVSKTAQALRLDYYGLKKRLESEAGLVEGCGTGFVELSLGGSRVGPECVLELEDGQGARLRVELKGAAPSELESLALAFWSVGR